MKWSNEEIDLLKLSYPELGKCAELQALFPNRTLTAITVKASKLGLHVKNNIRKRRTNVEYLELIKDTNFISLDSYKGYTELLSLDNNIESIKQMMDTNE